MPGGTQYLYASPCRSFFSATPGDVPHLQDYWHGAVYVYRFIFPSDCPYVYIPVVVPLYHLVLPHELLDWFQNDRSGDQFGYQNGP